MILRIVDVCQHCNIRYAVYECKDCEADNKEFLMCPICKREHESANEGFPKPRIVRIEK